MKYLNTILLKTIIRLGKYTGHGTKESITKTFNTCQYMTPTGLGTCPQLFPFLLIISVHVQCAETIRQWSNNLIIQWYEVNTANTGYVHCTFTPIKSYKTVLIYSDKAENPLQNFSHVILNNQIFLFISSCCNYVRVTFKITKNNLPWQLNPTHHAWHFSVDLLHCHH